MERKNNNNTSVEKFVDRLLTEGAKVTCDDSNTEFDRNNKVPAFYNEELYRKGQQFFYKHIFSMYVCKFEGLIAVLSIPSILKILISTGMSDSVFKAYQRYAATILHMMVWYEEDFKPGSKSWKSVSQVAKMHNSASRKCCRKNIPRITQKDMALTQFGFMGFAVIRGPDLGIHGATEEELRGFIHLWRVVGYLLGIEDRFNICTDSVKETKEILNLIVARTFRPEIEKQDKDFLMMSYYLAKGLSAINPLIMYKPVMSALTVLVQDEPNNFDHRKLNFWESLVFSFAINLFWSMQFGIVRWLLNCSKYFELWVLKTFPVLAYLRFGIKNSLVAIKI